VFRTPYRHGDAASPLTALPLDGPADLLALALPSVVEELGALAELAKERLLPRLHELAVLGPTGLGRVFAGSTTMAADADLVVGHTLVELKRGLGRKAGWAQGSAGRSDPAPTAWLSCTTTTTTTTTHTR
jgi:hypothetical protein